MADREHLEEFAALLNGWFWETDAEHRFSYLSASVETLTGVSPEWHYGKSRMELGSSGVSPADWERHVAQLNAHEPFTDWVFERVGPDGRRWLSTSGEPRFGPDGAFLGYRGVARDITNEVNIAQQTASFEAMFDQINEAISLWDENDALVIFNRAFRDLNPSLDPPLNAGMTFRAFLEAGIRANQLPGAVGDEAAYIEERLHRHRNPTGPFEVRRQDNRVFQVDEQRLPGNWIALVASEITELKLNQSQLEAAQEAAEEARGQLASAIAMIDEGFVYFDADDRLVHCNDRYRDIFSRTRELIVPGVTFEELIRAGVKRGEYPDAIGREEEWVTERLASHRQANRNMELRIADGRWLKVSERRTPDGGIVGFRIDITELKNAREAAEAASRAKSDFLATMSHEIRTPMTGVLGMSELLQKTELTSEQAKFVSSIQSSGRGLLGIINDILDQSKIEAGRMEIEDIDFHIRSVLEEATSDFGARAKEKDLWFTLEVDEAVPSGVHGDPTRLRQILFNLIGNAVKFTADGGVTVRVHKTETEMLHFRIEDTGEGIPEDAHDALFDRFRQADASTTRRFGGSGLGLSICKSLTELMGGEIGFESRSGEGSVFWFEVPLKEAVAPVHRDQRQQIRMVAARSLHVLVAEDNEINQAIIAAILADLGHSHEMVEDGAQAVAAVGHKSFDLILMDIRMPTMDGMQALEEIRRNGGAAAATPTIALTADVSAEHVKTYLKVGFDAVSVKPINVIELCEAVNDVLDEPVHVQAPDGS